MRILRSPMFVCSTLLIIAMVLTFTVFWNNSIFMHIQVMNWGLVFLNLFSLAVAVVYVFWVKALEDKKEKEPRSQSE